MHMLELLSLSVWSHSCSLSHSIELVDQGYSNLLDKLLAPKLHWSFNNTVVESTETSNHNGKNDAPTFRCTGYHSGISESPDVLFLQITKNHLGTRLYVGMVGGDITAKQVELQTLKN